MYVLSVYRYVYDTLTVSLSFFNDEDGAFAAAFCCCLETLVLFSVTARHHVHTLMDNLLREGTTTLLSYGR